MKKILVVLLLTGCGGNISFQKQHSVTLSWTEQDCNKCGDTFAVYRAEGICPSIGWQQIAESASYSYTDYIALGKQYSYSIEAINGSSYSGPSNCQSTVR